MAKKIKIAIRVSMPCDKTRGKAMARVCRVSGVSSVAVAGDGLEVVGEDVDAVCLVKCLMRGKKEFGHVAILLVEEVKDKKEEEEKKKKEAEEKKKEEEEKKKEQEKPPQCSCPGYPCYCQPRQPPYIVCEEPTTISCAIM